MGAICLARFRKVSRRQYGYEVQWLGVAVVENASSSKSNGASESLLAFAYESNFRIVDLE